MSTKVTLNKAILIIVYSYIYLKLIITLISMQLQCSLISRIKDEDKFLKPVLFRFYPSLIFVSGFSSYPLDSVN